MLDVGFVPLIDAAPLVAAVRLGLDRKHGIRLRLHRQASWAAIRDRLLSGELDAVHAMAALVHGVQAGIGGPQADLAILLGLNQNGQAITLSPALAARHVDGEPLADLLRSLPRRPVLAQTFPTGTHALWLYYWLAAQAVDPMRDIEAVSLPPSQMPQALAAGELDGFCAGEPWGAQAEAIGAGRRVIRSGRIWSGHPEKVLACRREFAALQPDVARALTTAVLEACRWLDEPGHRRDAVAWLAAPDAIGLPEERLAACLLAGADEPAGEMMRFHAGGEANFPWLSDARWFLRQFRRWGWLPEAGASNEDDRLRDVLRLDTYREAARALGILLPASDSRNSVPHDDNTLA
ncbi:ABC transporter substrate-binding protein [Lysobacter alkalisoli]|uniref:ABC transporter substrate-binding protein n=2 Tax=Marilutibacter alkalisoli TaxID=2591633 RepID=A0A514BW96_9GAMM|nr:ABC transporter substrate-binding protein [Lysobacter alkalisoli]